MMDSGDCSSRECTSGEHPSNTTGCHLAEEKYKRVRLYRNWRPACTPLVNDFTNKKYYVVQHHGMWHYGSEAIVRCLPGYMLPGMPHVAIFKVDFCGATAMNVSPRLTD